MFKVGDEVFYGLLGKCKIIGIQEKQIGQETLEFFEVRSIKNSPLTKHDSLGPTSILIPLKNAQSSGLRFKVNQETYDQVMDVLSSREFYLDLKEPWNVKQKKFEDLVRKEGTVGLAKVVSHLFVFIKKETVPSSIYLRAQEQCQKILLKELSEFAGKAPKDLEIQIMRLLKTKLSKDN